MENLQALQDYFYEGEARSESGILHDAFVEPKDYEKIVRPMAHKIKILVGRKGSGKSAILSHVEDACRQSGDWSVYLTPLDFVLQDISEEKGPAYIISKIQDAILRSIAGKIGEHVSSFGLGSDGELRRFAQEQGDRSLSTLDYVKRAVQSIVAKKTGIPLEGITRPLPSTQRRVERAVQQSLQQSEGRVLYVLIDDSDQLASAGTRNYLDVIWYEILAVRNLAIELDHVCPIVSVRKEIWDNFTRDSGNRDKYDQVRRLKVELNPDRETMIQILEKRLSVCAKQLGAAWENVYTPFFEGRTCKMPSSGESSSWRDYLVSSSRTPRDLVQLVSELAENAIVRGSERIGERDVDEVSHTFSDERVRDLIEQNKERYDFLETLIRSFILGDFRMSAEDLRKHLQQERFRAQLIDGKRIRPSDDIVFPLWRLLSNIGFITARVHDDREPDKYRFMAFQERQFSWKYWDEIQKYEWEIHPCYRIYLLDYKNQESNRNRERFEKKMEGKNREKKG